MTVINNKHKFIFVHVPKNAGTSITNLLASFSTPIDIEIGGTQMGELLQPEYIKRYGISKHSTSFALETVLGEVWNNYFKFAIVRNPFSRFISAYNFLRKWNSGNINFHNKLLSYNDINDFISSNFISLETPDNIFNKQTYWLYDKFNERIMIDKYIKIEEIDNGIRTLAQNIPALVNYDTGILPRSNSSSDSENNFNDILTKNSLDILYSIYRDDFDRFKYNN